jgi:hypothetical protein
LVILLIFKFQRCLLDALEGVPGVVFLNWPGSNDYFARPDSQGLTEVSGRKYLEDLLELTCRGLESKVHSKPGSSSSLKGIPKRPFGAGTSDDDMRYEMIKKHI